MAEICSDNRFEMIKWFKERLIERTNIETSPEEMAVIDGILFRFWQLGWLDVLFSNEMEDKKKLQEKEGDMTREVQIDSMAKATTPNKNEQAFICFGAMWADQHPHWIPLEEKRPPFDWKDDGTWSTSLPILIYSIHGISIGTFQLDHVSGKSYWLFDGSKHEEFSDGYRLITHWMPLPEEPRKEANDD